MENLAKIFILLGGVHALGFAVFHVYFWKIFRWKTELPKLHFSNRAILQILNLRLIYVSLLFATLCFFFTNELYSTTLGRFLLAGFSLFWLGRTVEQFIFLKANHWMINLLTVLFGVGFLLFLIPLFL